MGMIEGEFPVRYAILSDVHGRRPNLAAVLADAQLRGAHRFVSLGDVGGDDCLHLLCQVGALAVFGNYEVSGWQRLTAEHQAWVQGWPPLVGEDSFWAVHAAPWWPKTLHSVEDFGYWLKVTGQSWRDLFPYLTDDDHIWRALAESETAGKQILFHGHTHRQSVWRWGSDGRLRQVRVATVNVELDHRYVIGVGSVGLPEDGGWANYTLYDTDAGRVELIRLER